MADAPAAADLESYDSEIGTMVVRTPSKMNFALVIFRGIEDSYNVGADIDCRYTISGGLEVNTRDWVGLFKVGWRNQTDFICYEWAPEARSIGGHGSDMRASIKFLASSLPLDDGEFYQFCYVTSVGHVRGASTPFQFKQESMDDLVEVEDENGELLIIKTKTAVLEDQLKKSNELRLQLKQEIKILENEKDMLKRSEAELQKKLQVQKDVTDISNTKIKEIQEQLSDVSSQNDHLQGCIKALQERIEVVNQEKQSMESRLDDSDRYIGSLQEKIKALVNEKDSLTGRVKSLEEEKELYKGHFTSSEDTLQSYVQECERVKMALMEEQASKCRIKRELERVESEMLEQRKTNENILKSAQTEKENLSYLAERMRNAEDKLSAAEHCKMMLNEEVLTLKQAYEKVSADLEDSKLAVDRMNDQQTSTVSSLLSRVADLSGRLISTEREAQELREEVARCRTDLRDATEKYERTEVENRRLLEERKAGASETDGPLYALQLAQQTLKERYAKLDKKNDELKRVVEKANSCIREMMEADEDQKNEIRSLRERLLMGQEAYKEKYIEWEKLEAEIYRLKLGQSSTTSRESLLPSDADNTAALNGEEAMKLLGRFRHLKILYTTEKKINDDLAEQLESKNQEIERLRSLVTSSYPPAEYATIPRPRPSNNIANKRTDPGTTAAGGHVAQSIDDHAAVYVTDGPRAEDSVDGHCPSGLAHPLKPLPAPIIPERLHNTARLTSISKHHDGTDVGLNGVTALMDDCLVNRGPAAASNRPSAPPAEQQYSSFAAAAATTAADPEEDRFEDAIGGEEYVVKCPLCSYSCAYENVDDGTVYLDRHFELAHSSPDPAPGAAAPANPDPSAMEPEGPLPIECPVCLQRFSCFASPQNINDHVEGHFN